MEVEGQDGCRKVGCGSVPPSPGEVLLRSPWGEVEELWEKLRNKAQELQIWDEAGGRSPGQPPPPNTVHLCLQATSYETL